MEENTRKKARNYVLVEGYLRECYLKEGESNGKPYISGDVVVSINRFNAQRVRVWAFATKADGITKNKAYDSLKSLLGDKIVTIASYVNSIEKDDLDIEMLDEAIWEAATKVATKVWFSGSIEEYATISTDENGKEHETSTFSFRATNGSVRRDNDKRAFVPHSKVEIDGSIVAIRDEQKRGDGDDLEDTGRVIIDYLYVDYKGIGHKFKLYAGTDHIDPKNSKSPTFAEYVKDNYEVGQTADFNASIYNLAEQKTLAPKNVGWGQTSSPTVVTKFSHELRIYGARSTKGIEEDGIGYISKSEVTDALTKRRVNAKENWERSQKRKNAAPKVAEPVKGFGVQENADGFTVPDFTDF